MNTNDLDTRLIQLHDGAKGLRAELPVDVKPDAHDADILHMRASDETLDRYQEVIVASGWRLENYRKNPVIQNAHQYGDIIFTIGQALKTWVSGKDLLQTWKFASRENPFAKIARDLYRGGYLRAASVGFVPIRWVDNPGSTGDSPVAVGDSPTAPRIRRKYVEQELLEVSAVGIPANPNALALAVKDGAVEKSDLRELAMILRHLDCSRTAAVSEGPAAAATTFQTAAAGLRHSRGPEFESFESFCTQQAGLAADARAQGRETDGAQWLQLVREVRELAERKHQVTKCKTA